MKKLLVVLMVLLGVFLAIGCAGTDQGGEGEEAGTPEQAVTEVEVVTGEEAVTPIQEVVAVTEVVEETPVAAVTPAEGVTEGRATPSITEAAEPSGNDSGEGLIPGQEENSPIGGDEGIIPGQEEPDNTNDGNVVRVTPNR